MGGDARGSSLHPDMPRVAVAATHRLGRDEARRRVKDRLGEVCDSYGNDVSELHEEWSQHTLSFVFKAVGLRVIGTIAVGDEDVRISVDLPFAAVLFKGLIEERIRSDLRSTLSSRAA
jgi:hypothetical protein